VAERQLPKLNVAGSIPVSRSIPKSTDLYGELYCPIETMAIESLDDFDRGEDGTRCSLSGAGSHKSSPVPGVRALARGAPLG
jgi:hypothetical protein